MGIWDLDDKHAAFDLNLWSSSADPSATQHPSPSFAIATAPDESWSAIAAAWRRPDGKVQVSVVDYQRGGGWVNGPLRGTGRSSPAGRQGLARPGR